MGIIEVKNLSFAYDESAKTIDEVSFSIEEGTYTTIIGHNGSGKSTIAKLIAGLLEKASGSIMVDGMELNVENLNKIPMTEQGIQASYAIKRLTATVFSSENTKAIERRTMTSTPYV